MKRRPRLYVGYITPEEDRRVIVVPLDAAPIYTLPLRLDIVNHSPTGFAWGYAGSGPAQLALALLADHLGDDARAEQLHQQFKFSTITLLGFDEGWCLSGREIDQALADLLKRQTDTA